MTPDAAGTPGWGQFDAAGGLGVVGRGPTLPDAFAQTAMALFGVIADLARVDPREVREVRAHGDSPEALLVNWLNECLYVHDVEGFVACRVELVALDERPRAGGEPFRLHGVLHGEELDPSRHRRGAAVRGVMASGASLRPAPQGFEARVILDAQ